MVDGHETVTPLPKPYPGWPEHRYIYSTEEGDSCSCGWTPRHWRTDPEEWEAHVEMVTPEIFHSWEQIERHYLPNRVAERRTAEQTARELGEQIAREALAALAAAMQSGEA